MSSDIHALCDPQWICLASVPSSQGATVGSSSIHAVVPTPKPHKFFDSVPPALARHSTFSGRSTPTAGSGSHSRGPPVQFSSATPDVYPLQTWSRSQTPPISDAATSAMLEQAAGQLAKDVVPLQVSSSCVVPSAHYGYIYSLTLLRLDEQRPVVLASGSGDEDVKLWQCTSAGLVPIATLHNSEGGVLTLAARQGTLFAGLQGGCIDIWDLETWTLIRTLVAHDDDVLALCIRNRDLFSTSADGVVKRWDLSFRVAATWIAHEGIVLSCTTSNTHDGHYRLLTGASDNLIKIWDVPPSLPSAVAPRSGLDVSLHTDAMLYSLARFITFRSVSDEAHREDCRQAAHFLKACLTELGAETIVLPGATARNPLVLATFRGRTTLAAGKRRRRCLVYSHYDVIDAGSGPWASDPWTLDGRDGYLYGRGVSDNKGPTLAIACAASQLHASRQLECDVVMLVEGEEEAGSVGFRDALRAHKDQIGPIDVILLSNSYWLGEDTPCLTVGLRGVVQATIEVEGAEPDVHSGVEGGSLQEPMIDMVRLLAGLSDGTNVKVPGFYDAVREVSCYPVLRCCPFVRLPLLTRRHGSFHLHQVTATERATYESIVHMKQSRADTAEALMARWRHPSLSVHRIDVSGPRNATIIPSRASAAVSIRIVPDQDLAIIEKALVTSVEENFKMLNSPNTVKVSRAPLIAFYSGVRALMIFACLTAFASRTSLLGYHRCTWTTARTGGSVLPHRSTPSLSLVPSKSNGVYDQSTSAKEARSPLSLCSRKS